MLEEKSFLEDFQKSLNELKALPPSEVREAASEVFSEYMYDPVHGVFTRIDLLIRVWEKQLDSDNAERRKDAYHMVNTLKEIKTKL